MRKIFGFSVVLILFFMIGCMPATNDSISGTWKVTHLLTFATGNGDYYNFNSSTYKKGSSSDIAKSSDNRSNYSLNSGKLELKGDLSLTYDATIGGNIMYWYINNVEFVRLEKQ